MKKSTLIHIIFARWPDEEIPIAAFDRIDEAQDFAKECTDYCATENPEAEGEEAGEWLINHPAFPYLDLGADVYGVIQFFLMSVKLINHQPERGNTNE